MCALALASCAPAEGHPAPPLVLTAEERAWLTAHGPLRFAPDPAFPPLEWFDEQGHYQGLVADYFHVFEQRLGVPIEYVRAANWDEVLRLAHDGRVDGITAAQPTPERSTFLDWTLPILDIPNVIIVRGDRAGDVSLAGLAGQTVCVTQGNALHEHLRREYPAIVLATQADDITCLQDVSFGRAVATVENLATASWLIEHQGITNLRIAGDSGRSNPLAIAVGRDQPQLRRLMDRALASISAEERATLRTRWIRLDADAVVPWRAVVFWGLGSLTVAGALALTFAQTLRRRVAQATQGLEAELGERRKAEAALRQSQRKLSLHLAQTVVGVIEFDREFRVTYWNGAAERVFGWSAAEALGRCGNEFIHPADVAQVADFWGRLMADGGGHHGVNRNVTRDGRVITCEWFNTTLHDDDGHVTGVMSLALDVTERERREEAQVRAQRLESLALLAGGIAHDFNNLLTGILGNVSLLLDDDPPPPERREMLEETQAAAARARGLTRQLLTFARGGAPAKALHDLGPVVREAARFAAHGSPSACAVDLLGAPWPAEVDAHQVAQVVQNLVLNACEAAPGTTVRVTLGNLRLDSPRGALAAGAWVCVAVTDDGPGIAPEHLPRIFDPFFSTKGRGTGLGLSVCHSIVTRHGGALEVSSTPGQGTRFEVYLPASPGQVVEAAPALVEPAPAPRRVLVMDDEVALLALARRVLDPWGCHVEVAPEGAAAVTLFRAAQAAGTPFDVVVLDLTVPGGLGGVATLARLRELDARVWAVVSSGYSQDGVLADPAAHGFQGVLPKPWSAEGLRRVIAASPVAKPRTPGE